MNTPFYGIKTKKALSKKLCLDIDLRNNKICNNYDVSLINREDPHKKPRVIEQPLGPLKHVHTRVFELLNTIELPEYLVSKRGSSYILNHKQHLSKTHFYQIDLNKFFPMCSFKYIYHFFHKDLQMSPDVAYIMTDFLTINYNSFKLPQNIHQVIKDAEKDNNLQFPMRRLPTGSCVSSLLAFLSYKTMFDKLHSLAISNNILMTLYVDDITFSKKGRFPKHFFRDVKSIVRHHGHKLNSRKTKVLTNCNINITGVIINKSGAVCAPNKLHFKLKSSKKLLHSRPSTINTLKHKGIERAIEQIFEIS